MSTWTVLKNLVKKIFLIENVFIALYKIEQLVVMVKKLDGHISNKDYLMCNKIWNKFNMKNMSDYHDHYLKKMFYY